MGFVAFENTKYTNLGQYSYSCVSHADVGVQGFLIRDVLH